MTYLTRDAILGAPDLQVEDVEVREWGGMVRVKGLSAAERDAFEQSCIQATGKGETRMNLANVRAKLVARCLVDDQDERLFSDADLSTLGAKSAAAMERVFTVAQRLSGLRPEDVEELVKNSDSG